ncbi:unnamed protein product [Closterium sp. Naga37s-1]|nr:unnamed protein product [Closterium sp. Naga37s-1]
MLVELPCGWGFYQVGGGFTRWVGVLPGGSRFTWEWCNISGDGAFPIFTSPSTGPTGGVLTLVNLNFWRAAGGVFFKVQAAINATDCSFIGNMAPTVGGGVLSESFPAKSTPPYRIFSRCAFINNTSPTGGGGAININAWNPSGAVPSLSFLSCRFKDNSAPSSVGGAISVAGTGRVRFHMCTIDGNSAGERLRCVWGRHLLKQRLFLSLSAHLQEQKTLSSSPCFSPPTLPTLPSIHPGASGGAVYLNGASFFLSIVTFKSNRALGIDLRPSLLALGIPAGSCGIGSDVHAVTEPYSYMTLRFCGASFSGSSGSSGGTGCTGSTANASALFLQTVSGGSNSPATVAFCDGTIKPPGFLMP